MKSTGPMLASFATSVLARSIIWLSTCQPFMRARSHSAASFVVTDQQENLDCSDTWKQCTTSLPNQASLDNSHRSNNNSFSSIQCKFKCKSNPWAWRPPSQSSTSRGRHFLTLAVTSHPPTHCTKNEQSYFSKSVQKYIYLMISEFMMIVSLQSTFLGELISHWSNTIIHCLRWKKKWMKKVSNAAKAIFTI